MDPWTESASAHGLRIVRVREGSSSEWSFPRLRRELSEPEAFLARRAVWLYGSRGGIDVVVRDAKLARPFVAAVAEIDPPLYAGLRMHSGELGRLLGDGRRAATVPEIDRAFVVRAQHAGRAASVFHSRHAGDGFSHYVAQASARWPIVVNDAHVEVLAEGAEPSARMLEGQLDTAVALARELSLRAEQTPETQEETAARDAWNAVASKRGLSFDRRRWRIYGACDGVEAEVRLEGSPPSVFVTLRAAYRAPLGCGLYLCRAFGAEAALRPTGHADLDRLVRLHAQDADRANALLSDAAVRGHIAALAQSSNMVLTDHSVTLHRAGFPPPAEIAARLASAVSLAQLLSPSLPQGPFR